jgi:hypothetical protein
VKINDCLIVSAMHTGTRTLAEKFDCDYVHADSYAPGSEGRREIVVPLRDPRTIVESWQRRQQYSLEKLIRQFDRIDALRAFWPIPVDRPDRDDYVAELSSELGREIPAHWPNIGHFAAQNGNRFGERGEPYVQALHERYSWIKAIYGGYSPSV